MSFPNYSALLPYLQRGLKASSCKRNTVTAVEILPRSPDSRSSSKHSAELRASFSRTRSSKSVATLSVRKVFGRAQTENVQHSQPGNGNADPRTKRLLSHDCYTSRSSRILPLEQVRKDPAPCRFGAECLAVREEGYRNSGTLTQQPKPMCRERRPDMTYASVTEKESKRTTSHRAHSWLNPSCGPKEALQPSVLARTSLASWTPVIERTETSAGVGFG